MDTPHSILVKNIEGKPAGEFVLKEKFRTTAACEHFASCLKLGCEMTVMGRRSIMGRRAADTLEMDWNHKKGMNKTKGKKVYPSM